MCRIFAWHTVQRACRHIEVNGLVLVVEENAGLLPLQAASKNTVANKAARSASRRFTADPA
jgi:hypothetical protein